MHYPLMQSLNIIAGMLGKKVSTMWCMKMEWGLEYGYGGWLVAVQ